LRFLADECVAPATVDALHRAGHDVVHALEAFPAASDEFIASLAAKDSRILLTEDTDYGDIVFHRGGSPPPAVILLRMGDFAAAERAARLMRVLSELGENVVGRFVVVGSSRVRIRPLDTT
jgi:predicted nuclease of predicted toxin-antitoxin system